ncbi:MAG: aldo/keto reductase [Deltaproteobacteria bacterium]|nr:aldo/keto reductase [Deltaproteobacteria bacterium]
MPTRPFGSVGAVPVVGQGTWEMQTDQAASIAALRRGLDLGLTHIDTAEMYGEGACEEIVAEAIADRRDEVFLVSKVLPENASRAGTVRACEQSLRRLRTDRLDCYLLHWRGQHPLAETLAGFEALLAAGKIRSFGVSNFDVDDLDELARLVPLERCACNQVLLHLEQRYAEGALLERCRRHGMALVAYSPLGQGQLVRPGRDATARRAVLEEVARAHGATPHAVALAFLLRMPGVVVIPKASSVAHVDDNAMAAQLALTPGEITRIDAVFPSRGRRLAYV